MNVDEVRATQTSARHEEGPAQGVGLSGVSKTFGATRALQDVAIDVEAGGIHGLCGGNGSGKSTLIKILCGVYRADRGTLRAAGQTFELDSLKPNVPHDLGIRVVHQDLAVFPDLTVAENMALGSTYPTNRFGRIKWAEVRSVAARQIARFEIDATPSTLVRSLPLGVRTQVAIARALADIDDGGLLILDEPTAALPQEQVELLHRVMRQLSKKGHGILFVSHRLDEVVDLCDQISVLRDGQNGVSAPACEFTEATLAEAIVGHSLERTARSAPTRQVGSAVLTVEGLAAGPVTDLDLAVYPGEIVGVAGLLGAGRTELLRAIYGDLGTTAGTVRIKGESVSFARPAMAIERGVVFIPEDRVGQASFSDLTVDENLDVGVLREQRSRLGYRRAKLRPVTDELRRAFKVRASSGQALMSSLSGGNQQKVIMARWIRRNPTLMLLDEPTQGVDVGARIDIYRAVREVTDGGGAALLVASDFEELVQFADRAVVMREGRLVAHVPPEELSARRLTELVYATNPTLGGEIYPLSAEDQ